jgi:hypothetical protein
VLLAIGAYAVLRWRGRTICTADPRIVDRLMGLIGLCVLLSLSGGPSAFLSSLIGSIRCYGRAGLVAVALWSVATPIILHGLVSLVRRGWLRGVLGAAALGLALFDASVIVRSPLGMMFHEVKPLPAWAEWASRQPADTRLAVFPDYSTDQDHALRPWNVLYHRVLHRHAVLNAAEPELLNLDLGLLGASMHQLNPDALRYMLALGYNTLVFRQDFLAANPWIAALPWLERKESVADWHIYRANAQLPALATRTLRGLLAGQTGLTHAARVPAGCWITERFEVDQPVVVTDSTRVRVAWADADRQLVSRPVPALLQHVHTTGFPTYSVCTPNQPGQYSLVFLDEQQRWLAAKPYEVTDDLRTGEQALGEHAPAVSSLLLETSDLRTRPVRVTLTNTTPHYWQAHVYRGRELGSGRTLPYWSDPSRGSLALLVRVTDLKGAAPMRERFMFLPCDLPPHARRELEIPECFLPPLDQPARIEVRTHYQALPVNETAGAAVIRLERAGALTRFR